MKRLLSVLFAAIVLSLVPIQAQALEVLFSRPVSGTTMNNLNEAEVRAINDARPGATIDITNPFAYCPYAEPLMEAVQRGVHVHLYTFASTITRYKCGPQLVTMLQHTPGSSARVCETSCYKAGFGQLHSKTMEITYLNGIRRVFIGSNDWTPGSRVRVYNSLVVSSCGPITAGVHRWFKGMKLRKPISYFPKVVHGCGQTLFQFPRPSDDGNDNAFLNSLKHQRCHHQQIHVKASKWQSVMLPVIHRLVQLKKQGCHVHLLVGPLVGPKVVKVIKDNNMDVRQSGDPDSAHPGVHLHNKEILVNQTRCRHAVDLMGSANIGSYWDSENNLLRFPVSHSQCVASMRQWTAIWKLSHRL